MPSTDPLADMLGAIVNASRAKLDAARVPDSRFKQAVLKVLQAEGFIRSFRSVERKGTGGRVLEIQVWYGPKGERLINGMQKVSTPGKRVYVSLPELKPHLRRIETVLLSTPQGVLTGPQAYSRRVGGELLCVLW
jgi:small subunit ribosomal protein S8